MRKIIYIISAEYSGSTVVEALLGTLPDHIACGEVTHTFNRIVEFGVKRPCSCGKDAADCPVWGALMAQSERLREVDLMARYRMLDAAVRDRVQDDYILLDSSKRLDTLRDLRRTYGDRLVVVFLVRDLRSYLVGRLNKPNARQKIESQRGGRVLSRLPIWLAESLNWLRRTGQILVALRWHRIPHVRVCYDDFGRALTATARWLAGELQVPPADAEVDFSLKRSRGHMLQGNKLFIYNSRADGFRYEDAWRRYRFPVLCRLWLLALRPINALLTRPRPYRR